MPFYEGKFKTLEELEEDYNQNNAPKSFSFVGVLHRWCEPDEKYPIIHVSDTFKFLSEHKANYQIIINLLAIYRVPSWYQ